MKPRRIVLYAILPALVIYLGMKFYAQHRHIDLYVSWNAPMPAELAVGLHMEEHKIDPTVTIESPYESAADKKLSMEEIHRIRSQIAWSKRMWPFIDFLTIQSPTRVLARRTASRFMTEYQLVKKGDQWTIEGAQRSDIKRNPKETN